MWPLYIMWKLFTYCENKFCSFISKLKQNVDIKGHLANLNSSPCTASLPDCNCSKYKYRNVIIYVDRTRDASHLLQWPEVCGLLSQSMQMKRWNYSISIGLDPRLCIYSGWILNINIDFNSGSNWSACCVWIHQAQFPNYWGEKAFWKSKLWLSYYENIYCIQHL